MSGEIPGQSLVVVPGQVMVYAYDEEEWANVVPKDPDWSRQETDYLISLCQQLDLRFLVIADRYEVRARSEPLCRSLARFYIHNRRYKQRKRPSSSLLRLWRPSQGWECRSRCPLVDPWWCKQTLLELDSPKESCAVC